MSDDRQREPIFVPTGGAAEESGVDEIYSFVLRVHLHSPSGGKPARLRFHLEDVGAGMSWRLTRFQSIVERLQERVSAIEAAAVG